MRRKMVYRVIGIIIILLVFIIVTNPHIINLIRCGLPKVNNYKCFPYKKIKKSDFTANIPESSQLLQTKISPSLLKEMENFQTLSFIVIQDGQILYERYFGIADTEKINSFSAAKSIVSLLVGIAIDKGYLKSLDQKVKPFFPNLDLSDSLTIRDLLTMSSGLKWNENFSNPFSDVVKAFYTNNLQPLLKHTKSIYAPGKQFSYKCINSLLLGIILEKATNMPITQFAEKYLWQPLGAEQDALWTTDKNYITKTFCCFYASARDYARIGLLILNGGIFNQNRIISKDYIDQMITPATYLTDNQGDSVYYYGLHLWITKYQKLTIPYLRGMYGQYVFIIPDKNAVIVRLGKKRSLQMVNHTPIDVDTYLKAAFEILH